MSSPSSHTRWSIRIRTSGSLVWSPSMVTTMSSGSAARNTCRKPERNAAPGPSFTSWRTTVMGRAASAEVRRRCAVPSVEPSSTMTMR